MTVLLLLAAAGLTSITHAGAALKSAARRPAARASPIHSPFACRRAGARGTVDAGATHVVDLLVRRGAGRSPRARARARSSSIHGRDGKLLMMDGLAPVRGG